MNRSGLPDVQPKSVSGAAGDKSLPASLAFLCRSCGLAAWTAASQRPDLCPDCGSRRLVIHPELLDLTIAHIDCDAFYASVEKADNPDLHDQPVIVGGGQRGVVAAACYIARQYGVRSAMPSWQALQKCPQAVVIRPRMDRYQQVSQQIREMMLSLTPLVEPLSIDEAFLDLSGTFKLHRHSPAEMLSILQNRVAEELSLTVSIGLSANKSLAKLASDQDKPHGFYVIGAAEARQWLADRPVSVLFGLGQRTVGKLQAAGYRNCADLAAADPKQLVRFLCSQTDRLMALARGEDKRPVKPRSKAKSLSSETTFERDLSDYKALEAELELLAGKVSRRLKKAGLTGRRLTLKLKTKSHRLITRSLTLDRPTNRQFVIFEAAAGLLARETGPGKYWRLLGVGLENFTSGQSDIKESDIKESDIEGHETRGQDQPSLFDFSQPETGQLGKMASAAGSAARDRVDNRRREQLEQALDNLHDKMGHCVITTGRQLTRNARHQTGRNRKAPPNRDQEK